METTRILLDQSEIPTHWYNVVADLANPPAPPLGSDGQPVPPQKMAEIFPMNILEQEMSAQGSNGQTNGTAAGTNKTSFTNTNTSVGASRDQ